MTHDEAMASELTPELWEYTGKLLWETSRRIPPSQPLNPDDIEIVDWSGLAVDLLESMPLCDVLRFKDKTHCGVPGAIQSVPGTDAAAFCLCVIRAWLKWKQSNGKN